MTLSTRVIILSLLPALFITGCQTGKIEDYVTVTNVDPLDKIFRETAFFDETDNTAEAGTGEYASFQLALRSAIPLKKVRIKVEEPKNGRIKLPVERTGLIRYVRVNRRVPQPSNDRLTSQSGFYPDPICDASPFNLPPDDTQPIWITVKIPSGTPQGIYTGEVKITARVSGKRVTFKRDIAVKVYPVDLSATSLLVTNWFFIDKLKYCNDQKPLKRNSKRYWELTEMLVNTMASYRQNVALIDPLELTKCTYSDTAWHFDFENFNRMARLLTEKGSMRRLEGAHLAARESDWTSRFVMRLPVKDDSITKLAVDDTRIKEFYASFIPAFRENLRLNGWDTIYMQHVADEPIKENVESYKEISAYIKSLWPGVKIIEACHSNDLTGSVDIWVPQLNFLDNDYSFYKSRQDSSEEVWFYTCLAPQGEYANRFIELPLIKTRLLHWINYRYGITGYLHWGFNHWSGDPWDDTSGIITESGNILPGGDSWIVYPVINRVLPSIRLEAMRDGISDYELLRQYSERYPEEAEEMIREVIYGFTRYDTDIKSFRNKRHQILTELSR